MSYVVDSRVVEMKFDNSKFEKNIKQSMSTLEKFKYSLSKLTGRRVDVDTQYANRNINELSNNVERVGNSFTAMQAVAFGALAKIGSQVTMLGESLIKNLSVANISDGWNKYEQKTGNVQTLMNSTGKSVEEVSEYLEDLMWYSDETSFGFTDMTSALSTMVSSGGDIETLIPMIEGIGNATAYAGKGAAEFSRVIYNLNQSYSAGALSTMDWRSVELAGASSKQLKQFLMEAAEEVGTIKKGTADVANWSEYLSKKVITSEAMEVAFKRFAQYTEKIKEAVNNGTYATATEAMEKMSTEGLDEVAVAAMEAAQNYKSFSEAVDATKDAVSSGWLTTFETIFGNFEEAKELWTAIGDGFWEIFASGAEKRNDLLKQIFNDPLESFSDELQKAGVSSEQFESAFRKMADAQGVDVDTLIKRYGSFEELMRSGNALSKSLIKDTIKGLAQNTLGVSESTKEAISSLEKYQEAINKVMKSPGMSTGPERMKKLSEAGYDAAGTQKLINYLYEKSGKTYKNMTVTTEDLVKVIGEMSEAEAETLGITKEQRKALFELSYSANAAGQPLSDLIARLEKPSGRELFFSIMENSMENLVTMINIVKDSFSSIFTGGTVQNWYDVLDVVNNAVLKFKEFLEAEEVADEGGKRLSRTLKGIFAFFKIITTIVGGAFKLAFAIVKEVLAGFGMNVLDLTANIGDNIVKISEWIDKQQIFERIAKRVAPVIVNIIKKVKSLTTEGGLFNKVFNKVKDTLQKISEKLKKFLDGFSKADNKFEYFFESMVGSFEEGGEKVGEFISKLGSTLLEKLKGGLGIGKSEGDKESMAGTGKTAITEFIDGFKKGIGEFLDTVTEFGDQIVDKMGELPWEKIVAVGLALALLKFLSTLSKAVKNIEKVVNPLKSWIEDVTGSITGLFKALSKAAKQLAKAESFKIYAEGFLALSGAMLVLAAALWIIQQIPVDRLLIGFGALLLLLMSFAAIIKAIGEVTKDKNSMELTFLDGFVFSLTTALLAMVMMFTVVSALMGIMALMNPEQFKQAMIGFAVTMILTGALLFEIYLLTKNGGLKGSNLVGLNKLFKGLGVLFVGIGIMMSLVGNIDPDGFERGMTLLITLLVFLGVLVGISTFIPLLKEFNEFGKMFDRIAAAFIMIALAFKIISTIDIGGIGKGVLVLGAFALIIGLMVHLFNVMDREIDFSKFGTLIAKVGIAFLLLAVAAKIMATMSWMDVLTAGVVLSEFMLVIFGLAYISQFIENDMRDFAKSVTYLSTALLLLTLSVKLLGNMDLNELIKGTLFVGALSVVLFVLVKAFKGFGNEAPKLFLNILVLAIAINLLVIAVFLLGQMKLETLSKGVGAVAVLGMIAALIVRSFKDIETKSCLASLVGVAILIATMVACVAVIMLLDKGDNNIWKAVGVMGALTVMVGFLMGMTKLVKAHGAAYNKNGVIKTMGMIIALLVAITICLVILMRIDSPAVAIANASALSEVLLAVCLAIGILNRVDPNMSIDNMKALGVIMGVLLGCALILGLLSFMKPEGMLEKASSLSLILEAVAGAALILSKIKGSVNAGAVMEALGIVGLVLLCILVIAEIVGVIFTKFPELESWLDKGITIMEKLGKFIGAFFGGIVGGAIEATSNSFEVLANNLDKFSEIIGKTGGFLETMTNQDSKTASDNALYFIKNIAKVFDKMGGFKGISDGAFQSFEDNLGKIGAGFVSFHNSLGTLKNSDLDRFKYIAEGIQPVIDMLNSISTTGGLKSEIFGSVDLKGFTEYLPDIARQCKAAIGWIGPNFDPEPIRKASQAIKYMADASNELPEKKSKIAAWFDGQDMSLSEFAGQFGAIGSGLGEFYRNLGGKDFSSYTVKGAAQAVKDIADIAVELEGFDYYSNSLSLFSAGIGTLATALVEFYSTINEGHINLGTVNNAIYALNNAVDMAITLSGIKTSVFDQGDTIDEFGDSLQPLGEKLLAFYHAIGGISVTMFSQMIDNVTKLESALAGLVGVNIDNVNNFITAISALAELDLSGFIREFNSEGIKTMANTVKEMFETLIKGIGDEGMNQRLVGAVTNMVNLSILGTLRLFYDQFYNEGKIFAEKGKEGFKSQKEPIKNAVYSFLSGELISHIKSAHELFKGAGEYLTMGLRDGIISENSIKILKDAGTKIGKTVEDSTAEALDISSPSKVGYALGAFFSIGLANGITSEVSTIKDATEKLAESSITGFQTSIDGISDIINWDLNPVITPTLDLSYVKAGASTISSMFNDKKIGTSLEGQNGQSGINSGSTIQFTQNNYSPKSLSRMEIYRQTNNQINMLRSAIR